MIRMTPGQALSGPASKGGGSSMAQQANPKLIGAFVLGAIALLAFGLVVFGGLSWFTASKTYIAYFPGSVKGLRPGAPVDFRGVTIGQVSDIRIRFNAADGSMQIPVLMRFDPNRITVIGREQVIETGADLQELIKRGLRAQLQTQSIVTGLLSVDLDFYPNAPLNLVGGQSTYPELPTIPSTMETFQQTLGDVTQEIPGTAEEYQSAAHRSLAKLRYEQGRRPADPRPAGFDYRKRQQGDPGAGSDGRHAADQRGHVQRHSAVQQGGDRQCPAGSADDPGRGAAGGRPDQQHGRREP